MVYSEKVELLVPLLRSALSTVDMAAHLLTRPSDDSVLKSWTKVSRRLQIVLKERTHLGRKDLMRMAREMSGVEPAARLSICVSPTC